MFNRASYENSRSGGHGVLEIVPQKPRDKQLHLFVPLKRSELQGEIVGPLAVLRLTQVFGYTRQQSDKTLEALYRFPLPGDAAVTGVDVRFGEVEIRASLKERQQAEEEYAAAKQQGHQAVLTTRESADVFTLQVAGLRPDQDITVETSYVQLARAEGAGWSLRIPLTTAPRYVRSDEYTSRPAHGQPLWLMRDPGHRFALDLTVQGADGVTSPTHGLTVTPGQTGERVVLAEGDVIPDRDCVLAWRPDQDATRPTLQAWTYTDAAAQRDYWLALAVPPAHYVDAGLAPREVILLVDRSGSMGGAKWEAAEWAVRQFLASLSDRDVFTVGTFDNEVEWLATPPQTATAAAVEAAVKFMADRGPRGGTELGMALEQALHLHRAAGQMARHLLIVTDAQVSDAGRIFRLASEEAQREHPRRISVLCIDAAPNAFTATELAERGGGVARFLTSNPDEEDITTALDEVLTDWAAPIQIGLQLELNRDGLDVAQGRALPGRAPGWSAVDLGDLPTARPVWAAGRAAHSANALQGRLVADGRVLAEARPLPLALAEQGVALKALFGARRVMGLEYLINAGYSGQDLQDQLEQLGYHANEVTAAGSQTRLYAENVRADVAEALRPLLVREALDYGLASAETAFIAVRREAGRPVEGTVVVGNALPAGWSEDFLGGQRLMMMSAPMAAASPSGGGAKRSSGGPLVAKGAVVNELRMSRSVTRSFSGDSDDFVESGPPLVVVFNGTPSLTNRETVLFDTSRLRDKKATFQRSTLSRLRVQFNDAPPDAGQLAGLTLLLYVDDMAQPRAKVRLADLMRQGGERPLNVARGTGQAVRLVLVDEQGVWAQGAPGFKVELG